jgi:AraC-like DNA-binding protein
LILSCSGRGCAAGRTGLRFSDIVFVYHLRDERQVAWHGRRHAHGAGAWELHYFISGEGSFRNGGSVWSIIPGSLHLTPPDVEHQILATNLRRPITYYAVLFEAVDEELATVLSRMSRIMEKPADIGVSHRFFFADLLERHFSGVPELMEASRHSFMAFLYGLLAGSPSSYGAPENAHVEKAIAIMQGAIEGDMDLDGLCDRLELSREHFVRIFSARMRMPPMRYYARLKIEAAQAMLSSTNLRVHEISEKLGYANQFGFARAFRRVVGIPPSEYRARYLQKADFR